MHFAHLKRLSSILFLGCVFSAAPLARAQWVTQTLELKPGWNAVFLHVDAGYTNLSGMIGGDPSNPIVEVWKWNLPASAQFFESPLKPSGQGSEWTTWVRTAPSRSTLVRLVGDSAYLVRVGTNVSSYSWRVKGRPVPPKTQWTSSGQNLLGFPTLIGTPPTFGAFLGQSGEWQASSTEIYQYVGGELSSNNPARIFPNLFRGVTVKRGQAYWIRTGEAYNRSFGPFELSIASINGVDFGQELSTYSLRLRNNTTNALTVSVRLGASETPPSGQPAISGVPPLLVRGELNITNLTYGHTVLGLNNSASWVLPPKGQPGAEQEIVIGLNRAAITAAPGELLAGLLYFSDSLGQVQVDVPVTAKAASNAGLWVGGAAVTQVRHYLKSYAHNPNNERVTTTNGSYVVVSTNTSLGAVSRPFPLRLIVHNPGGSGNAQLLQRVYCGLDANTNEVVATKESALKPELLSTARRISAPHLPWTSGNQPWPFNGKLQVQSNLTALVTVGYNDQPSNPFVHTYHPDHDNLNSTFTAVLPQGSESYAVERTIRLSFTPPGNDFQSLTSASRTLAGDYSETVVLKGLARSGGSFETREFEVRGAFTLSHVSDVPQLTVVQ
jgi:hypothetical protein